GFAVFACAKVIIYSETAKCFCEKFKVFLVTLISHLQHLNFPTPALPLSGLQRYKLFLSSQIFIN
ncbi:hypothetical protein, partial [Chryseobacterium chendengshani]|uniref:hypothetical protein n=1 Tax=Chryseobacterium sp. LJ756 TaxID=2864113 RepID=UPI001C63B859